MPCDAFGCLSVRSDTVVRQFGHLLRTIELPTLWREAVAHRCREATRDDNAEKILGRRAELEAEQERQVTAFTKGYVTEQKLDKEIERIRAELQTLPLPALRNADDCIKSAISAGETLADMAGYWDEGMPEERRDMVWALLALGGLVYDLERQVIVGLVPRPAVLPVLAVGLGAQWEQRGDGLWLREEYHDTYAARHFFGGSTPPHRAHHLSPAQRDEARELVRAGMTSHQAAERMGVSYWVIFRLLKREAPQFLTQQQQPKLTAEQEMEARQLLQRGMTMRQVGAHFGVSYGAIWRMTQRDRRRSEMEQKWEAESE